jgi:hypothetical protein
VALEDIILRKMQKTSKADIFCVKFVWCSKEGKIPIIENTSAFAKGNVEESLMTRVAWLFLEW